MTNTTARLTRNGKKYEILVDLEEALKVRKGEGNISAAVLTNSIFHNLKSGENAGKDILEKEFGTSDMMEISAKIIKSGEIVLPLDYVHKEQDQKLKQVVDFLVKNSVSPEGRPYTPDRILSALKEANVQVKNKAIDSQIPEIVEAVGRILPIKIEVRKIRVTIPAQYSGKVYGIINDFKQEEEWLSNGDLVATLGIPAGLLIDFYEKLNDVAHGSILGEEIT